MNLVRFSIIFLVILNVITTQPEETAAFPMLRVMNFVCVTIKELMPFVVIICIVMAGIAYVAGPIFGAEMKGRATSWAASLIVGAIIGIIIFVTAKPIVQTVLSEAAELEYFCTREFGT